VSAADCKSINYKKQGSGNNCFLNKKNRKEAGEAAIEANQDFVYYNIDYYTQRSEEPEFGTSDINMVSTTTGKRISPQSFIFCLFLGKYCLEICRDRPLLKVPISLKETFIYLFIYLFFYFTTKYK